MKMTLYKTLKSIVGISITEESRGADKYFLSLVNSSNTFSLCLVINFIFLMNLLHGRPIIALTYKKMEESERIRKDRTFRIFLTTCHHPNYYFPGPHSPSTLQLILFFLKWHFSFIFAFGILV